MAYKKILKHPDDELIYPDWTWGDHRAMLETLATLELEDEQVRVARTRLDAKLEEVGIDPNAPYDTYMFLCEFCGREEYRVHEGTCPSFDPSERTLREAGAYQYMDEGMHPVHTTSAPCNDEEAADYFRIIAQWFPEKPAMYVLRRELDASNFKMIPFKFVEGKVVRIERTGG